MFSTNIRKLKDSNPKLARFNVKPSEQQEKHNQEIFEWTERQSRKFFSPDLITQVFTNRRSDFSDEALVKDFFSFEQPNHKIPRDSNFLLAVEVTQQSFQPKRMLHPVAYPDNRYYPIRLNTNVEAPWNIKNWRFTPNQRNVDIESELPKVSDEQFAQNWSELFKEWKSILFWRKMRLDFRDDIEVDEWLALKQKHGLINDIARKKHNLYPELLVYNRFLIHQIKDKSEPFWKDNKPVPYYWHTIHSRSHVVAADEPDKIRAVFGVSWLMIFAEMMFIWPLQHMYMNFPEYGKIFWTREIMRGGWRRIITESEKHGIPNSTLTADWSQFDKRLLFELIDVVHGIWRSYFDFSHYEETSFYNGDRAQTNPARIENLWEWVCYSTKHTPILLPDGSLYEWTRNGFGSGFLQTQLQDTFSNSIMLLTCLSSMGVDISSPLFWALFQGDDSFVRFFERMFRIYGTNFLDALADAAVYYFNARLNTKKSRFSDSTNIHVVLGYTNLDGLPYRTSEDLLRHLFYPETNFNNYNRQMTVFLGLAHASCGTNQQFYEFALYCYKKLRSKGNEPSHIYLRNIRWLKNIYEAFPEIDVFSFPSRETLLSRTLSPHIRHDLENQRIWPTRPGPSGRFYFLSE
nr:MAG: RNA-dependent RNA polymerase [Rhizoctonia solani dsRNA virus 18]